MTGLKGKFFWQVLMIYGIGGRIFNGIKSMYVNSAKMYIKINKVESEWYKIDS